MIGGSGISSKQGLAGSVVQFCETVANPKLLTFIVIFYNLDQKPKIYIVFRS